MASKHNTASPSTGTGTGAGSGQKRPATYGKTPRKRTASIVSQPVESSSGSWHALKSQTSSAARAPSSSTKKDGPHWTARQQSDPVPAPSVKRNGAPAQETPRKRKRPSPAPTETPTPNVTAQRARADGPASTASPGWRTHQPTAGATILRKGAGSTTGTVKTTSTRSEEGPRLSRPASTVQPAVRTIDMEQPGKRRADQIGTNGAAAGLGAPKPRRPRLIDTLAAQKADNSDSDPDSDPIRHDREEESSSPLHFRENRTPPLSQRSASIAERDARSRPSHRMGDSAKKKIKFTYGQARTFRNEASNLDDGAGDADANPDKFFSESLLAEPIGPTGSASFDFPDDEDDDTGPPKVGIKSVHELRRAGANHRFADEMDDLLSRIGNPGRTASSMRRNALLELGQKLQREDFTVQFRDHATRDSVAKDLGIEEDTISGFALAAVLVIFLSSGTAPHLLQQLANDRVGKLLARLLSVREDIDELATQRTMNLSRASKTSLRSVKGQLLRLRIWHGYDPVDLSPRRVALQLLDIVTQWSDVRALEELTRDVKVELAVAADEYRRGDFEADVDFVLIARVLETQSNVSTIVDTETAQARQHSSTVAGFLRRTLRSWPENRSDLEATILKLAINTTNVTGGAEAFDDGRLLSDLASTICRGFELVQAAVDRRGLEGGIYDELLLVLGVMINVLEHCPRARYSVDEASLARLVGVYMGGRLAVAQVCST